jgi:transcriptional regulator of acetoin/glycerol metabolism
MPAPSAWLARIDRGGAARKVALAEIRRAIDAAGGVVDAVAERLGVSRSTVFRLFLREGLGDHALAARRRTGARDRRNGGGS